MTISTTLGAAFALVLGAALVMQPAAQAQRGGGLRCQVFLTQARIPDGLSERALIGFARGHRAARMAETGEQNLQERTWLSNAVFSFNRPPGDLEFHALFYDVTDGPRTFIREMSVFVSDRTQRTVLHRIRLPRPTFRPNRRIEMVVTVQRQEVGSTRFIIDGEEVRHSGQVDFSDEEARQRD
ncbi:MAG: hypothetical protein AB7S26_41365 [Sandaracinaceae bacterium]